MENKNYVLRPFLDEAKTNRLRVTIITKNGYQMGGRITAKGVIIMWDKLKRKRPGLYETVEWVGLVLSIAAFLMALAVYLR